MSTPSLNKRPGLWLLLAMLFVTAMVYWPGMQGGWLFDDYPNIVDNPGVQITHVDIPSLTQAALSSPSSIFKRPLASLTFAANYLAGGLQPYGWKVTNLIIHLLNGLLVFLLARALLGLCRPAGDSSDGGPEATLRMQRAGLVAAWIAGAWMLLPINLTAVLYVVQRMESLANLFVLLGLLGYVAGRRRMRSSSTGAQRKGLALCVLSLVLATAVGISAKETAVMLPLYAFLIEWIIFGFRCQHLAPEEMHTDRRVSALFALILGLPLVLGLAWLLPHQVLSPDSWAARDFTLRTRLLSEARIVVGYVPWTLIALPHWLSFYHDNFHISTGLLHPWTTLPSIVVLAAMVASVFMLRRRRPLVALGIALYLGCHLLTGTILPLELIYEHRNYFASFGLMLAVVPWLAVPATARLGRPRQALLGVAILAWAVLTASTAYAWGNPLRLARELASRAPDSPRAQYSLGRQYIMASHYMPDSPYTPLVYAPLERAAKLPDSSILPQQALIFFNARMGRPIKATWWESMIASLKRRTPGVQDESSLAALSNCARQGLCKLPPARMTAAYDAALSHPDPSSRLLANYGDYAWNVLGNHNKGLALTERAVATDPNEPAYHITLARMYIVLDRLAQARTQVDALRKLNIGGRLDGSIAALEDRLSAASGATGNHTNEAH